MNIRKMQEHFENNTPIWYHMQSIAPVTPRTRCVN